MTGVVEPIKNSVKTFAILKDLPLWLLTATTLAHAVFIAIPRFIGLVPSDIRPWIEFSAVVCFVVTVCRLVSVLVPQVADHQRRRAAARVLRFVPLDRQRWWHLAKQRDDTCTSQISMKVQASNTSDRPVQIVKVRLLWPRAELIQAEASLPMKGSPYHSHEHPVPPKGTETAAVQVMVRGAIASQGKPIRVTLGLTDQYGEEYKLRNLKVDTYDQPPRRATLSERLQNPKALCITLTGWRHRAHEPQGPVMPWAYDPASECIGIAESILMEEKRSYAARGRERGGLGSLNVGLQSEPNYGGTTAGEIPSILSKKGEGKTVTSPNLERIIGLHSKLGNSEKDNIERYLLTNLCRESTFADVAYFIFLALHRMGRSIDALKTARTFLSGDKMFAYSNLLGTLSVVVSHEHHEMEPNLYPLILDALAGDEEPNFRIREKINLARLEFFDREARKTSV